MSTIAIMNLTRSASLANAATVAADPFTRFIGLLGKRSLPSGGGLLLRPCSSIHMFGMRFPIDAVYVAADNTIVKMVSHLAPWQIGLIVPQAEYIIELPAGTIATTTTCIGDQLSLEQNASHR